MQLLGQYYFHYSHSCMLLPKDGLDNRKFDERILIIGQFKNAYIYNVQDGTTSMTGRPNHKRKFSQIMKIGSKIYVIGGDVHNEIGGFHLHLLGFLFIYQFNSRIVALVQKYFNIVSKFVCCGCYMKKIVAFTLISFVLMK